MIETVTAAAKMKAIIAALSLLLLGGSMYEISGEHEVRVPVETKDQFTLDIQHRSDLVNNTVTEAMDQQGKQSPLAYKQTCESSMVFIRGERLDTNTNYNTLDPGQKILIENYRAYLEEAANVVLVCSGGETPDRTKMKELKAELY